jgi:hypothetical protein
MTEKKGKADELLPIGTKPKKSRKKSESVPQPKDSKEAVARMGTGIVGVFGKARDAMERYSNWVQEQNRKTAEASLKREQEMKAKGIEPTPPATRKPGTLFMGAVNYPGLGQAARPGAKPEIPEPPARSVFNIAMDTMKKKKGGE